MEPSDLDTLTEAERKKLKKDLQNIYYHVKKRFRYVPDKEKWGKIEHWENYDQVNDSGWLEGDCDFFAMACRKACRKKAIPSRLVVCRVRQNGVLSTHLVLECNGWILCNVQEEVVSNVSLDYTWLRMSGYERGDDWHYIEQKY